MTIIFYHPETLQIKGISDGNITMDFPYIKVKENYHSAEHLAIELDKKGKAKLVATKGTIDDEDFI